MQITVNQSGLIIDIEHKILSPVECLSLIQKIKEGLFDWSNLTGKKVDGDKPK
jgi:hypothetical protein